MVNEGLLDEGIFELRPKLWEGFGHLKMRKNVLGQMSEVALGRFKGEKGVNYDQSMWT